MVLFPDPQLTTSNWFWGTFLGSSIEIGWTSHLCSPNYKNISQWFYIASHALEWWWTWVLLKQPCIYCKHQNTKTEPSMKWLEVDVIDVPFLLCKISVLKSSVQAPWCGFTQSLYLDRFNPCWGIALSRKDQIQLWLIAGHWWPSPPHTKPTKPKAGLTAMVSCHLVPQLPPNLHLTSPLWHHHQHHHLSQLLAPLSRYKYKSTQRVRRHYFNATSYDTSHIVLTSQLETCHLLKTNPSCVHIVLLQRAILIPEATVILWTLPIISA